MSTNDPSVRVPLDGTYGHGRTDVKPVQFPGEVGRAPRAHIPGQPFVRPEEAAGELAAARPVANPLYGFSVGVQLLHPDARVPTLGTELSAGYDLSTPEAVTLQAGERSAVPLGFALALPPRLHGRIESRSGLALKGLVVLTGVIDADYRGEVKVILQNFSGEAYSFAAGDRVAQLVLRPTVHAPWELVQQLDATGRGAGGFGSTGV